MNYEKKYKKYKLKYINLKKQLGGVGSSSTCRKLPFEDACILLNLTSSAIEYNTPFIVNRRVMQKLDDTNSNILINCINFLHRMEIENKIYEESLEEKYTIYGIHKISSDLGRWKLIAVFKNCVPKDEIIEYLQNIINRWISRQPLHMTQTERNNFVVRETGDRQFSCIDKNGNCMIM